MSNSVSSISFHAPVTYPLPANAGPTTIAVASDGTLLLVTQSPVSFGVNPKYEVLCTVGKCANGMITFDYAPTAFFHQNGAASGLDVAMDDNGRVVLVFSHGDDLWYVTGILGANHYIVWNDAVNFDSGDVPSVAINNSGSVVEAHRSQNDSSRVFYHYGSWVDGVLTAFHEHGKDLAALKIGLVDSVSSAINSSGQIVVGFSGGEDTGTMCNAINGEIEGTKVKWFYIESQAYAAGDRAMVSIDEQGRVVATYMPFAGFENPDIRYRTGTITDGSKKIDFDQEAIYSAEPGAVTNSMSPLGNYVVLFYQTNAGAFLTYADGV